MDKISPISEVRANLPDVIDEVSQSKKKYIVTRHGKPVAVILSPQELEKLETQARKSEKKPVASVLGLSAHQIREKEQQWDAFRQWEENQEKRPKKSFQKNLRAIGDWVDSFLGQHPQQEASVNVSGIQSMLKCFSKLGATS